MGRVEETVFGNTRKDGHGDAVFMGLRIGLCMRKQTGIHDMDLIVENLFSDSTNILLYVLGLSTC
jgi:hypothetical protein